jgi:flagellar hook-length control protein FliK
VSSGAVRSRQTLELTLDPEGLTDLIGPRTAPIGGEQSRQMPMPRPIAVPDDPPHAEETVPRLPAREAVASPPARDGGRPEAEIRPVASPRVPPPAQERGHAVGSTTVIPDARQRAPEEPTRDPSGVRADIRPPDRSTQPPISAPLRILAADGPEHRAAGAGHLPASEQAAVREVPTAPAAERGRPSSSPPPHPFEAPTPGQTSDEDVAYPRRAEGLKDGRAPAETGAPRFGAAVQEPRPAPLPDRGEPIEPPRRAMLREGPAGDARSSSGHVPARAPGAEIHRPSLVAGEFGVPESAGLRVPPASEPAAAVFTIREPARISPVELAAGRTQRLVVEVDPPELGRCELQLSLREGQVRATLIAERPETAMTLRAVESQVREQLAGQNLQVAEFDVRFTARGGADHGAHRGDTGRSPSRTPARMRPSDDHSRAPRSEPGSSTIDVMA